MADNLTACQIIIAHHSDMIYSRLCRSSFSPLHFFPVFVYLLFCSFAAVSVKRQTDDGVNVFCHSQLPRTLLSLRLGRHIPPAAAPQPASNHVLLMIILIRNEGIYGRSAFLFSVAEK